MKRTIIIITLIFSIGFSKACDICGCGVGGYYIGLLPDFSKRFAGIRYQQSSLLTQLDPYGNRTALTREEDYRSMEVWGAWNIGNKWRVLGIIPYNFNQKYTSGSDMLQKKNGLGDIVFNGYYKLFESSNTTASNKLLVQSLWLGAGVKLPTGEYDLTEQQNANGTSPNIFQLGTGSLDFMANMMYDIRIQDFGINANASYKINTENKDKYHYGNKLMANASAYYKISLGRDMRIAPNIGLAYEKQNKDRTMGYLIHETGGNILNGSMGVEINLKQISLGATFQTPISQNLGAGRIDAGNKFLTHVSFSF